MKSLLSFQFDINLPGSHCSFCLSCMHMHAHTHLGYIPSKFIHFSTNMYWTPNMCQAILDVKDTVAKKTESPPFGNIHSSVWDKQKQGNKQTLIKMEGGVESVEVNKVEKRESHWGIIFERAVKEGSSGEVTFEWNPYLLCFSSSWKREILASRSSQTLWGGQNIFPRSCGSTDIMAWAIAGMEILSSPLCLALSASTQGTLS